MKKVLTYGTFDIYHTGHVNILRRARELGDYLIVGISTDAFNEKKGKEAYYSYEQRKVVMESVKYVDEVIEEHSWDQKEADIDKFDIDVLVMGDHWKGRFDYLQNRCEVVYLPRTVGISTTQIKKELMEDRDKQ